jgi:hypothetical protein
MWKRIHMETKHETPCAGVRGGDRGGGWDGWAVRSRVIYRAVLCDVDNSEDVLLQIP